MRTLDFTKESVQQISLDELKLTHKENDIYGKPLKGAYHYEIIDNISDILLNSGLKIQIDEIFAAQNRTKDIPGVALLPQVEEKYGKNAIEAHILRRIYANISVRDFDTDEYTTNVAMAFHQNGIQVAYGTMVKVCHNQCIMSPERVISTDKNTGIKQVLEKFEMFMQYIGKTIVSEREKIEKMKQIIMTPEQILMTIGCFTAMRVQHDTRIKSIRTSDTYPLNQYQIGMLTEDLLLKQQQQECITLWDMYNCVTNLYKADRMEIPNIFSQHLALNRYINQYMGINE